MFGNLVTLIVAWQWQVAIKYLAYESYTQGIQSLIGT